jgi:glucokinase
VNLINISSVELISLSGGISNAPAELLLDPLRQFIQDRAYVTIADKVRVCRSALGEDAPLIGAALLYRESQVPDFAEASKITAPAKEVDA